MMNWKAIGIPDTNCCRDGGLYSRSRSIYLRGGWRDVLDCYWFLFPTTVLMCICTLLCKSRDGMLVYQLHPFREICMCCRYVAVHSD